MNFISASQFGVIGITGRVGSGKSLAASIFQRHFSGTILDLDRIGHTILQKKSIKEKLIQLFGQAIVDSQGDISRKNLGELVFSDRTKLQALNQVIHPEIKKEVVSFLSTYSRDSFIFLVGALIEEIGLSDICDHMIVIDATDADIIRAIGPKFERIAPFQRSRGNYIQSADFVVQNEFDLTAFEKACLEAGHHLALQSG